MFNNNATMPFTMPVVPAGNGGGGFGGEGYGGWFWLIIIILLFGNYGWNNGLGLGGGGNQGTTSVYEGYVLNNDMSMLARQMSDGFASMERKGDTINNGICDGFYTNAQLIAGVNTNIANSQSAVLTQMNNNAVNSMKDTFAVQTAINGVNVNNNTNTQAIAAQLTGLSTQLQQCCCDSKYQSATQFADLTYRMAEQNCATRQAIADSTAAITANQDANTRAILDFMTQDKIATLTAENQNLKFAASQQAQNAYLVASQAEQTQTIIDKLSPCPKPAYIVAAPQPINTGCGCCNC